MLAAESLYAANARSDGAAQARGVHVVAHLKATVLHGACGCRQGIKRVAVVVSYHGLVNAKFLGLELLYLGSYLHRKPLGVKRLNAVNSAAAIQQVVPKSIYIVAKGRHTAQASNDNSLHIFIF